MKRSERHKIKKDEFSTFMVSFIKALSPYWKEIAVTITAIIVILIVGFSYKAYVSSKIRKANYLLGKYINSGKKVELKKYPVPFPQIEAILKAAKLAARDKFDEAIEVLKEVQPKGIMKDYIYFMEGELLSEKGDCEGAIKVWRKVSSDSNDFPYDALLVNMGRCQFRLGKTKEAIATYNQIISLFPNSPYIKEAEYKTGKKGG